MKFNRKFFDDYGKNIISVIIVVIVFGVVIFALNSTKINTSDGSLKVSGMYGISVDYKDISKIELKENLPANFHKTNGIDLFGIAYIGNFRANGMESIKAYVRSNKGPFIYLTTEDNKYVIISTKDKKETEEIFNELDSRIKK
jgi:hypothetical protein